MMSETSIVAGVGVRLIGVIFVQVVGVFRLFGPCLGLLGYYLPVILIWPYSGWGLVG